MPLVSNEYVEHRSGGYYVKGARVSLDSVIYAFRRGEAPDTILEHFPAIGSLAKVYGAIAFALDHPQEMDEYLASQERTWVEARKENPQNIVEKAQRARQERTLPSS